jgi:hypothetical protein
MTDLDSRNIYQLLAEVMREVPAVAKKERNQQQNFSFRGIDAVLNAVSPVLSKYGVVVTPKLVSIEYGTTLIGKDARATGHVHVTVEYIFWGPNGDFISTIVPAEAMDYGDKATAKVMSVAFRTALLQTLSLQTDDKDADHDTYERSAPVERDPDPLVSEGNKQRIVVAFADIGMQVDQFLTLGGVTYSEWDALRETGRVKLLTAFSRAKADMPASDTITRDKPRVDATVTPIYPPISDETKAAHPSNGPASNKATVKQLVALRAILRGNAYSEEEQLGMAGGVAGRIIGNFNELTKKEASELIGILSPKKD